MKEFQSEVWYMIYMPCHEHCCRALTLSKMLSYDVSRDDCSLLNINAFDSATWQIKSCMSYF